MELVLGPDHRHSGTGQDVTRPDKDGITDTVGKLLGLLDAGKLSPLRLLHTNAVKNIRELGTILGLVNIPGVSSEDLGTANLLELQGNVLGKLATERHDS
jgi:hypothetical protein